MDTNERAKQIAENQSKKNIYTKGDLLDHIQWSNEHTLWAVNGHRILVKRCKDGRGGYWIYSPDSRNRAHVRRIATCTDAEGIQAFLSSERGRTLSTWTFDREGNAHPYNQ